MGKRKMGQGLCFGRAAGRALLCFTLLLGASACCHPAAAQRPWPLWEAYTQHFVDDQGRVIDHSTGDRTTSEGQAYGMFFALVDDDRARFDKMLHWTEANLAAGDLSQRLPAWSWGHTPAGVWAVLDANSASDADLWLAYDLLEAGRLWHQPRYQALGAKLAARIAQQETISTPGSGSWLTPGPRGFHPAPDTYILNPSYMPLPLLERLSRDFPAGPWRSIESSLPRLLSSHVGSGFAMDWVSADKAGVQAALPPTDGRQQAAQQQNAQPEGSYDAIRVYLWAGIADPATPGIKAILPLLSGMKAASDQAQEPPARVNAAGQVLQATSPPGFAAAMIPFLRAVQDAAAANRLADRLSAARDVQTGLYGKPAVYYDQNLALFSTGHSEGRFRFGADGKLALGR